MEVCAGFELIAVENATALGDDVLKIGEGLEAAVLILVDGVRPKGHIGLEKDWAAILGRLGLIQGRDGGARQPAERRAALL